MLTSNKIIEIQERENFDGKKENIALIDCNECLESKNKLFHKEECILCILVKLYSIRKKKFKKVIINADYLIDWVQIRLFLQYFNKLNKIKNLWESIKIGVRKKCNFEEFKCRILPNFESVFHLDEKEFCDPIGMYLKVLEKFKLIDYQNVQSPTCLRCYSDVKQKIKSLLAYLENTQVIQEYKTLKKEKGEISNYLIDYRELLSINSNLLPLKKEIMEEKEQIKRKLIEIYNIGNENLYKILIYHIPYEYEKIYEIEMCFKDKEEESFSKKIVRNVEDYLTPKISFSKKISLEDLIEGLKIQAINFISKKYNFTKSEKERLGFHSALRIINLEKIFPLLIDDFIEEIFLDSDNDAIYINHQKYGRCRTLIDFNAKEIERLKSFLRLYSGKRLDYSNPSIKFVIKNKYFYCRFTTDVEPVNFNHFALDIRKLNKNIFTIQDLLKNKTLSPLMAAFLYFNELHQNNITSVGKTDTGKTTLINALDLLAPKNFRKVYVENAVESLNQKQFKKHQLKYKVDSIEDAIIHKYSKQNQIKKLLHRSPDIIYLGEILTQEEAEAMFHCLSAGLKGFQTIHANSLESLINRFLSHFKIDQTCLNDLDLLVLMKKNNNERKIIQIAEIEASWEDKVFLRPIFKYNPKSNDWDEMTDDLFRTKSIQQLTDFMNLDEESFSKYITIFEDIFKYIKKNNKLSNTDLIEFFHKISYLSKFSFEKLEDFWNRWKTNLRL